MRVRLYKGIWFRHTTQCLHLRERVYIGVFGIDIRLDIPPLFAYRLKDGKFCVGYLTFSHSSTIALGIG